MIRAQNRGSRVFPFTIKFGTLRASFSDDALVRQRGKELFLFIFWRCRLGRSARHRSCMQRYALVAAMLLAMLVTLPSMAIQAAAVPIGHCVNHDPTKNCYPSISRAVASGAIVDGDTITIAADTYPEGNIFIDKNLTLVGADPANTIVQADSNKGQRVFQVADGKTATISNLTLTGGNDTQAAPPAAAGGGGALFVGFRSIVTLNNVLITGNKETGGGSGGGIFVFGGTLTLNGCTDLTIICLTSAGGGITNQGTLAINNSTIKNNTLTGRGDGAGIYNVSPALTITKTTISGNTGARYGGGVANITNNKATITDSTIANNSASDSGGGLYNDGDPAKASSTFMDVVGNSTISGNIVTNGNGGGITNLAALTVTGSTITGNTASNSGGGMISQDVFTMTNSTISNNTAKAIGGGINFTGGLGVGIGTITGSTISGNIAAGPGGGGIVSQGAKLTLTNSTISGNSLNGPAGTFLVGGAFFVTGAQ